MSPSAVLSDLNATFGHIIDGKLVKDENAKTLDVINPATEKVIASVPIATRDVSRRLVYLDNCASLTVIICCRLWIAQ